MKVITLLSIFVLFFIINILFAVSSKKNLEDSSNQAVSQFLSVIKMDSSEGSEIIN